MEYGNSGSFTLTGTQNFSVVIDWTEAYEESNNYHIVLITACKLVSHNWYGFTYYPTGTLSINGTPVVLFSSSVGSHSCTISTQGEEYPIVAVGSYSAPPWSSDWIEGNADGTKSVSISASFTCYTTNGQGGSGWSVNGSQTVTLHTIARTSSISMQATTLGSAGTVNISRQSSSFTHTITYSFGDATGTIAAKTSDASASWTPPISLAAQIPSSTSGACTLTCYTYSGEQLVGTSTATVTLSVPASVKPTFTSITAARVDGTVPSSWGIYVQTKSKATLTINGAAGANGSTIAAYSITGGGMSYTQASVTTGFLNTSGSITFTGKVCDSRGRWSDEKIVTIQVVEYSPPRFRSYKTQRCTGAGTSSANGTYGKSNVSFTYWTCGGKNTISTKVEYKKSSDSTYINASASFSSGQDFVFGGGNLSTDFSYDIRFTLTDAFISVSVVESLSTASVLMDFKAGGTGLAVGKVSETENCFEVSEDWNVKVYGMLLANYIRSIALGAIAYGTCDSATDADEKVATVSGNFELKVGAVVAIKFTNYNSVAQVKMNINGTGARYIVAYNNYLPPTYAWKPMQTVLFIYDGSFFVAFMLNTATTAYYGLTKLINSTSSTSTSLAATAAAVKAAYDRNSWESITLTNPLAIAYGGTGAATAPDARVNLGIGTALLWSGSLTTGNISFAYGDFSFFVVIGTPSTTGSKTAVVIPRADVPDLNTGTSVVYQFADETYYFSFYMAYSGDLTYIAVKGKNGAGQILSVYAAT